MTKRPAHQPPPLADDPTQPSYIRELLDAGRDARVSGYDFDRGYAVHVARVQGGPPMPDWAKGLPSGALGAAGAATTSAGGSLLGWLGASLAVAGLVTAAVLVFDSGSAPTRQAPSRQAVEQAPASTAATNAPSRAQSDTRAVSATPARSIQPSAASAGHVRRSTDLPAIRVNAQTTASSHPRVATSSPAPGSTSATQVGANPTSAASSKNTELFATARPAVAPQRTEQQPVAEAPAVAPVARPAAAAPMDDARLEREMGMLAVAQRVLRDDPARALKLARQGEAEFHDSMFTEERQQLLLLALVKLGRLDEARQLAKPYLARFPHGPYSERVRLALASGQIER